MIHSSQSDGSEILGVAAIKGHTEIVEKLIEAGAVMDYQYKV